MHAWQFDVIAVYNRLPSSPVKKRNKPAARHDQLHSQSVKVDQQAVIITMDSSLANMTTTGKEGRTHAYFHSYVFTTILMQLLAIHFILAWPPN